ncbi:hypothetical protein [Absidia glauca]|uniref:FK506-binding protein n=1 Tax=Absidia glauca TaxID=4829 RepID=A0A168RFG2_ABSGL|nr:hypothetical protein [Absidia glauca]
MSIQGFFGKDSILLAVTLGSVKLMDDQGASLAVESGNKNTNRASLCLKVDDNDFVLCSLTPGKVDQQLLDLIIVQGEQVTFSVQGQQTIHLTGNYLYEGEGGDDEEDSEEGSEEELDTDEAELMLDDEDDESNDEDLLANIPEGIDRAKVLAYLNGEIDSDDMGSDSEEELDESRIEEIEEDEEEEEEAPKPLTKKEKKAAAAAAAAAAVTPAEPAKPLTKKEKKAAAAAEKEEAAKQDKKRAAEPAKEEPTKKQKVEEKKPKVEEKKPKQQEKKQVTKLPSGLIIEDIKVGEGANVRSGARIGMRYIGKLTNGKVFDKNVSGKPFNFRLGAGEVIKGWDQGIVGMKLGGERKLTIPAPLAYGKRGAPPQIPGNATLVFEIKLVAMK